ncbi:MAG: AraC family transcriptional regulator [Clostridia bacterium]|nr:AraC family transcriptional regulator [Clostridia bacterium]
MYDLEQEKEKTSYGVAFSIGNTLFEISIHERKNDEKKDSFAHNHYVNELLLVLDGKLVMKIGQNEYTCEGAQILYVPKQTYHISYYESTCYYSIGFSMKKEKEAKQKTENTYALFEKVFGNEVLTYTSNERLNGCFSQIALYMREYKLLSYYLIQNELRKFFILLTEHIIKEGHLSVKSLRPLGTVHFLIYERLNFANVYDMKLKDLAKELYISERQLARMIKQIYGLPFGKRKTVLRMQSAKEYLEKTDETLESIAAKLYFHDVSSFVQAFKKFTGVTPTEYRRQSKAEKN